MPTTSLVCARLGRLVCTLAGPLLLIGACTDTWDPSDGEGSGGGSTETGGTPGTGGAPGGGNDNSGGSPATGGASGHGGEGDTPGGQAGEGGAAGADNPGGGTGGNEMGGAAGSHTGGGGGVDTGGTGGAAACVPAFEPNHADVYTLALSNKVELCNRDTFSCETLEVTSGVGTFTLTPFSYDAALAFNGALSAPTLSLKGPPQPSLHQESYEAMLVQTPGSATWASTWDPTDGATSITLWGDTCWPEFGNPGAAYVTINPGSGALTSLQRTCETEYATVFYRVTTSGTGQLSCP